MSLLDTIMAQSGLPALRRVFGDAAIYTPPTAPGVDPTPVTTWALLRKGSELVGEFGERFEPRLTAQLPLADLPQPLIGSTLDINAAAYQIDQLREATAYLITVALRPIPRSVDLLWEDGTTYLYSDDGLTRLLWD